MDNLKNGLILYHGSYCEVKEADLTKCSNNKDFGQGFYLITSKQQAKRFLETSIVKAITSGDIIKSQDYGFISMFKLHSSNELRVKIFENANKEWLHCFVAHRKRTNFKNIVNQMNKYDVIVGKIADDATNTTLIAYLGGAYGRIGDKEADDFCINKLLPNRLKDQYCFKTEKAISCLEFVGSEKIWLK